MPQPKELGWHRLFFTKSGDLDLSWFLVSLYSACAVVGFAADIIKAGHPSLNAWAFIGSAFIAVLIAAVPISKARLLANSTVIASVGDAVGHQPDMYHDNETGGVAFETMDREDVLG